ncbi:hypothetical protein OG389_16140 [Streptomyces sp. NBC_00435]|uniref:hypothetical protein n=1 Tax=Streptomyces sp. NBC_00435 TaxID=2903649 RepID=UPI002E20A6E6
MGRRPTNKYAAVCAASHCAEYVQPGAGLRIRQDDRWQVYCQADAPQEQGTSAGQPAIGGLAGPTAGFAPGHEPQQQANRFSGACMECSVQVDAGAGALVAGDDGKRGVRCPVCQNVVMRRERWDENDQFGTDRWIPDETPWGCAVTIPVRILALQRKCWKCSETTACVAGLYPQRPARADQWARSVDDTSRVWIKPLLEQAGFARLAGAIKPRWSSTAGQRYMSSGCERCDALQGDFPVDEEASDLVRADGVDALDTLLVAEVPTPVWQRVVHGERGEGGVLLM